MGVGGWRTVAAWLLAVVAGACAAGGEPPAATPGPEVAPSAATAAIAPQGPTPAAAGTTVTPRPPGATLPPPAPAAPGGLFVGVLQLADHSLEEATRLLGRPDEIAPFEGIPLGAIRPPDGGANRAEEARWHATTLRIIFIGGKAGLITARFPAPLDPGDALRALGLGVLGTQRPSADLPEQVRWANTLTNPPLACVRLNREPPAAPGGPVAWFFVTVRAGYTPAAC